ncbi:MAG: hypothetical protein LBN05_02895 [Oscillospiraceae bacterium]|jgi:hypothetical protein|nr:hypothetical protein [Oscillospiraceae bacterium]
MATFLTTLTAVLGLVGDAVDFFLEHTILLIGPSFSVIGRSFSLFQRSF